MAHKGGRPTDYPGEKEIAKAITRYLDFCEQKSYLPTVSGFAVELNVSKKTLYNWGDKHPEFLHLLDTLLTLQETMLIQNGLKSEYNPTIAKLMLAKHGYSDKVESDITSGGKPLPIYGGLSGHDINQKGIRASEED